MARPLPNSIKLDQWDRTWSQNDLSDYIAPHIAENILAAWKVSAKFLQDYILWIIGLIILVGLINIFYQRLRKKQRNINKLWNFLLFFLSKRQMMIPLLCTLGKRNEVLSAQKINRLIDLRDMSRHNTVQEHPRKRIALEEEISELLYTYFTTLEKSGKLKSKTPFHHIMQDLEYIDQKLIELQTIYNKESSQWNKLWGNGSFKTFGLKHFQTFGE